MNINISQYKRLNPGQAFRNHHDSECHIHIHTVKVRVILACRSRTEQQATQGTIHHLNVPPSLHRAQIQSDSGPRHSCSDLSEADSPAEQRLTPTERDISWWQTRGGAHSLPASCSVSRGTLAELRQQSVRRRAAGIPSAAPRWETGVFTLRVWLGLARQ